MTATPALGARTAKALRHVLPYLAAAGFLGLLAVDTETPARGTGVSPPHPATGYAAAGAAPGPGGIEAMDASAGAD